MREGSSSSFWSKSEFSLIYVEGSTFNLMVLKTAFQLLEAFASSPLIEGLLSVSCIPREIHCKSEIEGDRFVWHLCYHLAVSDKAFALVTAEHQTQSAYSSCVITITKQYTAAEQDFRRARMHAYQAVVWCTSSPSTLIVVQQSPKFGSLLSWSPLSCASLYSI